MVDPGRNSGVAGLLVYDRHFGGGNGVEVSGCDMKGVSHFVHDHGVGPSWLNCWAAVIMRQAQQGRARREWASRSTPGFREASCRDGFGLSCSSSLMASEFQT